MWLVEHIPQHVQQLALHIKGKFNWAADGLSRDGAGGATAAEVLSAAEKAGFQLLELSYPTDAEALLEEAARLPQSAKALRRRQRKRR